MDDGAISTEETTEGRPNDKGNWVSRLLERIARTEQWVELHNGMGATPIRA